MSIKYKLILFDLDGTLFDYQDAEWNAFYKTFKLLKVTRDIEILHNKYREINQNIWKEFEQNQITAELLRTERFRRLFQENNLYIDAFKASKIYLKYLSRGTKLIKGAYEIIQYFTNKCKIAIITNGLADVQNNRIRHSNLKGFFEYIFISEEVGSPKPDEKIFKYAFQKIGHTNKKTAIIVGDNLYSDILGGKKFSIDTCWYNPENRPKDDKVIPDYEIKTLAELKKIVNSSS